MLSLDVSGIYQIKNIINNKIYIGSALNFRKRFNHHKYQLKNNKHYNDHLQKSWNKYGKDNFKFEILEIIEDLNKLTKREQYWIDIYKPYKKHKGYNIRKISDSNRGIKWSKESKQKLSDAKKGNSKWTKLQKQNKSMEVKNYFKTKKGKQQASQHSKLMTGKTAWDKGIPMSDKQKQTLILRNNIPIIQTDINKIKIINLFNSSRKASRELNINASNICQCSKGSTRHSHAGGFKWIRLEDLSNNPKLIRQLFFKESNN